MRRRNTALALAGLLAVCLPAFAGSFVETGDLALRHDLQRLADAGVLSGTMSTWPLAWAPILAALDQAPNADWPRDVADAAARVRRAGMGSEYIFGPR